jgi:hypothetical protein
MSLVIRRVLAVVAGLMVLPSLILTLPSTASVPAKSGESDSPLHRWCDGSTLVDYQRPLRKMRSRFPLPSPSRARARPPGLSVATSGPILVGPAKVGFWAFSDEKERSGRGWTATTTLWVVTKAGKPSRKIASRRQGLTHLLRGANESKRLGGFLIPRGHGYYRLDIEFERFGTRVSRYGEYIRALPRRENVRIGILQPAIKAGEKLTWRVENYGTLGISFGFGYEIQRYENDGWVADPITPDGFTGVGFFMGPGLAAPCQSLAIPPNQSAGRYRIVKNIEIAGRDHRIYRVFDLSMP